MYYGKVPLMSNLIILKQPDFIIFNDTELSMDDIRWHLYETYEEIAYGNDVPDWDSFMSENVTLEDLFKMLASERAFEDLNHHEDMEEDQINDFDEAYGMIGTDVSYDILQLLLWDRVCFVDRAGDIANMPLVGVW